ncbi:AEC family transporter [Fructilactobacillus carniphilus]|uniref:AEC family transporter n=1 Tax=Fructilactobacillus carniphilus TaxID=2940297 RepID=A0ABY5C0M8_9LACO|nr:AEC family transporter [Fructilactobacillus carniphilus]USS90856.1 AEC family transporter [Fructilactobacillus carniphilus]
MTITDAFVKTLTNPSIVSAITSTIFIILLGFFLRKKNIFSEQFGKTLAKVTLTVAIPALALNSFMAPIDGKTLSEGMSVLIWGFLIIIIFLIVAPFLYIKLPKSERDVMGILTTFGSTTFFGIPIVGAVLGPKGIMYSSIFNIGYRVFLYSYAYIKMSGLKMELKNVKKMLLNPVVIATFLGLILWLIQDYVPHVTVPTFVKGVIDQSAGTHSVAFFRIDQTALWLWTPLNYLAQLASPLAWLSIGVTLGSLSFKQAAGSKISWYYGFNKVILVPLVTLVLAGGLSALGILPMSFIAIATMVIMMATPTATVASAYAISFNRNAILASNASLISTVLAVIMMPIWIALLQVINSTGLLK